MSDTPYSVRRGSLQHGEYLITHCEWHPCHMGIDIGCNESGVRKGDDFNLIQHGWHDFDRAGKVITKGLDKGWSVRRIERLMQWMLDRMYPFKFVL